MPITAGRIVGGLAALACGIAIGIGTSARGQSGAMPRYDVKAGPGGYLLVRIDTEGPLGAFAHGHVVVARQFHGEARYDPATPDRSLVSIDLDAGDLEPDRPEWRDRTGLRGRLPGWQRDAVRSDMLGPDQLDAAHYPAIRFISDFFRPASTGIEIDGTLDLHGRQRRVKVPVALHEAPAGALHASGSFAVRPSEFDIRPYSVFGGLLRNKDHAEIRFDLEVRPDRPASK